MREIAAGFWRALRLCFGIEVAGLAITLIVPVAAVDVATWVVTGNFSDRCLRYWFDNILDPIFDWIIDP